MRGYFCPATCAATMSRMKSDGVAGAAGVTGALFSKLIK
jgi:hypothetical protein